MLEQLLISLIEAASIWPSPLETVCSHLITEVKMEKTVKKKTSTKEISYCEALPDFERDSL